jgi:hypothetical protein
MKTWLASALAIGISLPGAALAGAPAATLVWAPRYTGKFVSYFPTAQTDLVDAKAKNARIAKRCPTVGKLRGARLKVQKVTPPSTSTSAFFAAFPDGDQIRQPSTFDFTIDVEKLTNAESLAAIELDTPFVAVGGSVANFLSFVVRRLPDDSLQVFLDADGKGDVGTPLALPADTPAVVGQLVFANDTVDAFAKSCTSAGAAVSIGSDVPFVFDTSLGVGAGILGVKGDEAGFNLAISGDLYTEAKATVLEDLQAIIALELAAAQDLGNSMPTEAKAKLDQARALILTQGPEILPPTVPATFRPPLVTLIAGLPASDANEEALKRLAKAASRDQKAGEAIDAGTAAGVQKALKEIEKANADKLRAKAVLETGVKAEAKF